MNDDLISRKKAINAMCDNCDTVAAKCAHFPCERFLAMEQLPSADVPDTDVGVMISRQSAIEMLDKMMLDAPDHRAYTTVSIVLENIKDLPSAEPQIKKGKWIKANGMAPPEYTGRYVCSECGHYALMKPPYGNRQILSNFCPNCGAKMGERRTYETD